LTRLKDNLVASRLIYNGRQQYAVDYHVGTGSLSTTKRSWTSSVDIDKIKTWDDYIAAGKKVTQGDFG